MYNKHYYAGLVAPLQTAEQVCALLDDPAVRRKYGSQCDAMKQRWMADKAAEAKMLAQVADGMVTEEKLAPIPMLTDVVTKPRTPPGTFLGPDLLQPPINLPATMKGTTK